MLTTHPLSTLSSTSRRRGFIRLTEPFMTSREHIHTPYIFYYFYINCTEEWNPLLTSPVRPIFLVNVSGLAYPDFLRRSHGVKKYRNMGTGHQEVVV
jgi:hypothetical protein